MSDEAAFGSQPDLTQVLDAVIEILDVHDEESVITRTLDAARRVTSARYAAIGVLDDAGQSLERFRTSGIDREIETHIGARPTGRGVLGELIVNPVPLRMANLESHPRSYGFPSGHPAMQSFLGVPMFIGERPYGHLYVTEKLSAPEFTEHDEESLVLLARLAGIAIDHDHRHEAFDSRQDALDQTTRALDATVQMANALSGQTDPDVVFQLVAKRARALVDAETLVVAYEHGPRLVVAAVAGVAPDWLVGRSVDISSSLSGEALAGGSTLRLEHGANRDRFDRYGFGRLGVSGNAGMIVPLMSQGHRGGALIAVNRIDQGPIFSAQDQAVLEAFAATAATAIATARSAQLEQRSQRQVAAEQERVRWARELHDETLQNLAALRLRISARMKRVDANTPPSLMVDVVDQLDREIGYLRGLIRELRPLALEHVGLEAALRDLVNRIDGQGLSVKIEIDDELLQGMGDDSLNSSIEPYSTLYRICQEALNNVNRHSRATNATVRIRSHADSVRLTISDNGTGFDPHHDVQGCGLDGMRERAELLEGDFAIDTAPGLGTTINVTLPRRWNGAEDQEMRISRGTTPAADRSRSERSGSDRRVAERRAAQNGGPCTGPAERSGDGRDRRTRR